MMARTVLLRSLRKGIMYITRNLAITALLSIAFAAAALAQETKIKRSDLPAAVEKTVAEVSKDATIKGLSKETEKGKTTYEVELLVGGHSKDVEIDADGAIREIEEEVALGSLPAEVKEGLTRKAAGGKILKVES